MRRLATLIAASALIGALALPGAAAGSSRPVEYLALGDSLAFGYSPLVSPFDPDNFVGYPDIVAAAVRDNLTNASCPGETSSHFIDLGGADHGCGFWRSIAGLPLHTSYSTTQLEFVDAFLAEHPKTRLITLDLGINDAAALRDACLAEADPTACLIAGLPGVLTTLSANLDTIYGHIRNDDGYRHKLVALTVYSPNFADPLLSGAIAQVNQVLAERTLAWGGIVADGFGAFAAATAGYGGSSCAAGLLVVVDPAPVCDDHASAAGHALLAETIVSVLRAD